jgi:hypothetical protein
MSLRDLTHDAHKNAETQPFVKVLFSGKINPKLYATFLKNQHPCYEILEVCAMPHQLLHGLPDIRRAPAILSDFQELWTEADGDPQMLPTTDTGIANTKIPIIAHILPINRPASEVGYKSPYPNVVRVTAAQYIPHATDLNGLISFNPAMPFLT